MLLQGRLSIALFAMAALGLVAEGASAAVITQWNYKVQSDWDTDAADTTVSHNSPHGFCLTTSGTVDRLGGSSSIFGACANETRADRNSNGANEYPYGVDLSVDGTKAFERLYWGDPVNDSQNPYRAPSSLDVSDVVQSTPASLLNTNNDTGVAGFTIAHNNQVILANEGALLTTDLKVRMKVSQATPVGPGSFTKDFNFDVGFKETLNNNSCYENSDVRNAFTEMGYGAGCPDRLLLLTDTSFVQHFVIGNVFYQLVLSFSPSIGLSTDKNTYVTNGCISGFSGLCVYTRENKRSLLESRLRIYAYEIPEPAALSLLGAGALMLAARRRRRA